MLLYFKMTSLVVLDDKSKGPSLTAVYILSSLPPANCALGVGFYNAGGTGGVAPAPVLQPPAGAIAPTGEGRHLRRYRCACSTRSRYAT